jgi:hypothetical protein
MEKLVKVVSIDEEFEKGRGPDKRPRKRRVVNWYNKREGTLHKISDHDFYTVHGLDSVREAKVKWDDGTTEWVNPSDLVDKETGKGIHKMSKEEAEGRL